MDVTRGPSRPVCNADNTGTWHRHVLPRYLILPDCEPQDGSVDAYRRREEYLVPATLPQLLPRVSVDLSFPTILPGWRLKTLRRAYGNLASVSLLLSCAPVPFGG